MEISLEIKKVLANTKNIYCIGIGGVGLSALARYFKEQGFSVSGSDAGESRLTEGLQKEGISVHIGQRAENISDKIDCVFYSVAVKEDNPELARVRELQIPVFTYAEGLGYISSTKKTIAVAGTHGKTTTTAMVAGIMRDAGLDPTVIMGSLLSQEGTNFIAGKGEYFLVEACEYNRSFLELSPYIAVITNIDNDHLDYYGSLEGIIDGFFSFTQKIVPGGFLVVNTEAKNIDTLLEKPVSAAVFDYVAKQRFNLLVPGEHMQENARAAFAVGKLLDLKDDEIVKSLEQFPGTWRRSEFKGTTKNGVLVYDDYGHHPTEIKATLEGFRAKYPTQKIAVLFQPHLYSRTKLLFNDFVTSFDVVDTIYVAPIYAAREPKDETITSQMIVDALMARGKDAKLFLPDTTVLVGLGEGDLLITLGAGEMYKEGEKLLS